MLYFLLRTVKMPRIVDILTFMNRKKNHALNELSRKLFYNLGTSISLGARLLQSNVKGTSRDAGPRGEVGSASD